MTEMLTIDDLATLLRTTPAAVRQMRYEGRGPVAIKIGPARPVRSV